MNHDDTLYTSDIYVGNPPQKIRALFDTGSSNTWILSSHVKNVSPGHFSYNMSKSTTLKKTDNSTHIQFGTGSLDGFFVYDDVRIGLKDENSTDSPHSIHIKNYKFGVVDKQSGIFDKFDIDAIVGMGYQALAADNVTPILDSIDNQGLLLNSVFSYYYTFNREEASIGQKSYLTLGYYDKTLFKGNIRWFPITLKVMYGVQMDDMLFNGKSLGLCKNKTCTVAFDSGSTYMSVPGYAANMI